MKFKVVDSDEKKEELDAVVVFRMSVDDDGDVCIYAREEDGREELIAFFDADSGHFVRVSGNSADCGLPLNDDGRILFDE